MNQTLDVRLPREPGAAAQARRLVERYFGGQLSDEALDDVRLVATELVDNAYVHGEGQITLRLLQRKDRVRVEVIDQGQGAAIQIHHEEPSGQGHGLRMVDHICTEWGAYEGTTHVWAELLVR